MILNLKHYNAQQQPKIQDDTGTWAPFSNAVDLNVAIPYQQQRPLTSAATLSSSIMAYDITSVSFKARATDSRTHDK